MQIITGDHLPIKSWATDLDQETLNQARNMASLPFAENHVCLMPDAHAGYGMPIGGVMAAKDVIVPNAVGKDIGCGMTAVCLKQPVDAIYPYRDKILKQIQKEIPTGFNWHKKPQEHPLFDRVPDIYILQIEYNNIRRQLGTLGGGNHFIELQKDQNEMAWVMLHSGSRNIGSKVCDEYNRVAREKNVYGIPDKWQLWGLSLDSPGGREYLEAMNFCLEFARANRQRMMEVILDIIKKYVDLPSDLTVYDIHHNYAAEEEIGGEKLMVHRKGAVKAVGEGIIIPGSMGSPSYICVGRANPESFRSCSHGAGRAMGRNAAKRTFTVESVLQDMKNNDISLYKAKKGDVAEECRQAYKDIDVVMENQRDLVKPVVKLMPIGVVKG